MNHLLYAVFPVTLDKSTSVCVCVSGLLFEWSVNVYVYSLMPRFHRAVQDSTVQFSAIQ